MWVLLAWVAAAVIALVVIAAVGVGLVGHVRRLARAAGAARQDLEPRIRAVTERVPERPQQG